MTVGQHKQDVLTGAPVARLSVLARLHAGTELKVMTFPAEPYWGSGSYCLGLGPSDGLQCKSEGRFTLQMADGAFCESAV